MMDEELTETMLEAIIEWMANSTDEQIVKAFIDAYHDDADGGIARLRELLVELQRRIDAGGVPPGIIRFAHVLRREAESKFGSAIGMLN